ncbi:MAG: WbqC family protein, partial [Pseudomonadota bacterium]
MSQSQGDIQLNNSGVVAVMQPYVFPYIGYFNLMACASHFVLYDDVNYIKQGWISRNRILNNGNPLTFSVPISQGSSNSQINEVKTVNLERFKKKFLKTLEQAYAKAKYYDVGYEYVDEILGSGENTISNIARLSITYVSEILEMNCKIYESSKYFSETRGAGRSERLINITKKLDCSTYVNSANGSSLYDKKQFECSG